MEQRIHHSAMETNQLILSYKQINETLDTLFESGNKKSIFLYEGYATEANFKSQSEFTSFVLMDKDTQKMSLTDTFTEVINFLQWSQPKIEELCNQVNQLVKEEARLRELCTLHEIQLEKCYWRKLFILQSMVNKK